MKEQTIERPTGEAYKTRTAIARVPSRSDIENLKVGDLAPDCFGKLSRVTRIHARKEDIHGKLFVCYYAAMSERDTPENGCGCSNSMKEGELVRTVALTGLLNSEECDQLEAEMATHTLA